MANSKAFRELRLLTEWWNLRFMSRKNLKLQGAKSGEKDGRELTFHLQLLGGREDMLFPDTSILCTVHTVVRMLGRKIMSHFYFGS